MYVFLVTMKNYTIFHFDNNENWFINSGGFDQSNNSVKTCSVKITIYYVE